MTQHEAYHGSAVVSDEADRVLDRLRAAVIPPELEYLEPIRAAAVDALGICREVRRRHREADRFWDESRAADVACDEARAQIYREAEEARLQTTPIDADLRAPYLLAFRHLLQPDRHAMLALRREFMRLSEAGASGNR